MKQIFDNLPTKQRRRLQTLLGAALVLTVLGVANTSYGHRKHQLYDRHYREALSTAALPAPLTKPFMGEMTTPDLTSLQLDKMKASVEFYAFVTLGGKCFLALAGVLFLLSLFYLRRSGTDAEKP